MDMSNVILLVSVTQSQDEFGVWQTSETARQVFCQVDSVTRQEFFDGGRNGLNPELRFTLFRYDYENEPVVEYSGRRYAVYRTFLGRNDTVELYCERKGGIHG